MKLFGPMYERTLRWARHRNATWLLAFLTTLAASIFPALKASRLNIVDALRHQR